MAETKYVSKENLAHFKAKEDLELAKKQDKLGNDNKLPASYIDGLSSVATSGNYDDLSNKPSLATVATSGSYEDLTDKPTIPEGYITSVESTQMTVNAGKLTIDALALAKVTGLQTALDAKQATLVFNTAYNASTNKAATMSDIATAIAGVTQFKFLKVDALPTAGEAGTIYLVPHSHGTQDSYDEYIWVGNAYEKLGNTDIDLSNYWSKSELVEVTDAEIDAMFA